MSVTHHCPTAKGDKWAPGPASKCPLHQKLDGNRRSVWGKKEKAKLDRAAGSVGTQRDGFISGH